MAGTGRSHLAALLPPLLLMLEGCLSKPAFEIDRSCGPEMECMKATDCYKELDLHQIIFSCSNYGEPLRICCPMLAEKLSAPSGVISTVTSPRTVADNDTDVSPSNLLMPTTVTAPKTEATTKSSTVKPSEVPVQLASRWSKLPKNLREKAKLLPEKLCGTFSLADRIIAGQDSDLGQFPWMALIGDKNKETARFWCGGTLISKRYILTAAHCVSVGNLKPKLVRLGEWNVSSEADCKYYRDKISECTPPPVEVDIEEMVIHEKFGDPNSPSYQNDIALLRLANDVNFTEFISPICLPSSTHRNFSTPYTISGWGISETESVVMNPVLQFAAIKLFDFEECISLATPEVRPLAKSQFCAGGDAENACKGDSGGPLSYTSDEGKMIQKGIVSLATTKECTTEGRPTIYTEVSLFVRWILTKMR